MPYTIKAPEGQGCLRLTYEGEVTSQEILDCLTKTIAMAAKTGNFKILADCRRMTGGHSKMVLEFVASVLAEKVPPAGFREAVLLPDAEERKDFAEHYERSARELGYEVRLFLEEGEALDWLLK
ncbi:MAG TPA: hypothetical protein DEQ38_01095 [Elusimicrobia bacterium]|nr:MAG: hypothetical protein A2089_11725 [Elusimicrobia bacterium GWD2_63_28]HCC46708.1 hypothetical protein [Elusimicrobiota bacterium]